MRHFKDFKKHYSIYFATLSIALIIAGSFSLSVYAQTADELSQKIDQKNSDISKLEAEIKSYQAQLSTLAGQKNTLSGSIKELDITSKKLKADLALTQDKIDRTNLTINGLSKDIGTKQNSINTNTDAIALEIRQTSEIDLKDPIATILSDNDFSNLWNNIDNMITLRESIRGKIVELTETKGELEDTRTDTVKAKDELVDLKSKLADQKKIVDQNTTEKNRLLSQTKNSETAYQKLLASQSAKKAALEKELRDYESQLKYILDPKSLPTAGSLSWPLDSIYVTQLFGKTVAAQRLYASGSHSGVDFKATVGTPVKAMADGVVEGSGNTDITCPKASFGQWVFIRYTNGLSSTFGHLSLIKASAGQKVSRGDIVGYSGATGHVTGPHLHVTVYAPDAAKVQTLPSLSCPGKTLTQPLAAINAYLNPMTYLPPYTQPK